MTSVHVAVPSTSSPALAEPVAGAPTLFPSLAASPLAPNPVTAPVNSGFQNNLTVNLGAPVAPAPTVQFIAGKTGHGFLTRALWFLCIGWWLSGIFMTVGLLSIASVILMPVGFWFINRVPQAQTLRSRTREFLVETQGNVTVIREGRRKQLPWFVRVPYAWTIGLIAGFAWLTLAWIVSITIIGYPLSIWMIDRAPRLITLQKN